ncbi:MAG: phosphoribosyltransferase [Saprospiraceae bacterium]|jgi:pyrimidine operon attenuation protein/uracil phosphoribosyltransferase|nr:phosphoribosyltransferase [Saprospiraceae bacterium]MBK6477056.1 phosphoribosyltransferase [Saprospiraceae bacterium]MBK6814646.1 phosphoribosyltransferase [Saprospiraceae bacterium]MBK7370032.1 phosphoribosyltransferase [Saprospiraceae bacterium]MBK7437737.1 phosphoribosyltransferase [Saprospiraceae bacterium]
MKILNESQIRQKIRRLAIEILEKNSDSKSIILAGINNKGYAFAELIKTEIKAFSAIPVIITRIKLNPADPLSQEVTIETPFEQLDKKNIIIVDDVANTGRTLYFAMKPLFKILPKKIEVAVLVDRMHKSFPIHVDYVGLSLSTTMEENIEVNLSESEWSVDLN